MAHRLVWLAAVLNPLNCRVHRQGIRFFNLCSDAIIREVCSCNNLAFNKCAMKRCGLRGKDT
jgi:hypothetical protein